MTPDDLTVQHRKLASKEVLTTSEREQLRILDILLYGPPPIILSPNEVKRQRQLAIKVLCKAR